MSQPPPPPSQPPSGGFGPPPEQPDDRPEQPEGAEQQEKQAQPEEPEQEQEQPPRVPLSKSPQPPADQPDQSPQTPPGPPSYGYPQQPGQPGQPGQFGQFGQAPQFPHTQPPPYGYPQQPGQMPQAPYGQAPAYGQPPAYGQQPGYGPYPTQPMYGGGVQPPGGGNKNAKILAVVAAVVVVLLVAGGCVWFLTGDDGGAEAKKGDKGTAQGADGGSGDSGGSGGEKGLIDAELAWTVDPPKVDKQDIIAEAPGTWFVGDNIVKATTSSTTAYDMKTGKVAWSIDMPRPKDCTAAFEMSENRTVVQYGRRCEFVMGIDLVAGKELWSKELPSKRDSSSEFSYTEMAVSGDIAAAAWIGNAVGYDLSTGKELWQQEEGAECKDRGYSGGSQLVAKLECGFGGSQKVQGVGPGGKKEWQWDVPDGIEVLKVLSTDPLVLGVNAGGESSIDITDLMILSDSGKLREKISVNKDRHELGCRGITLSNCPGTVVEGDTLYTSSKPHQGGGYGQTSEIIAFDLTTGKSKWLGEPTTGGRIVPVTVENGALLAYELPGYDKPGQVVTLAPKTGKPSPRMKLPAGGVKKEYDMATGSDVHPFWKDGHFFLVNHRFYASAGLSDLAIAAYN
ncbi:PQQ-binding-like beta-propeller repeat protein [Streptomyces sp. HK10]|uniref:outer membrane protein assembly factor BamB family protein n=1 Tax=Streptomyces sp. HK10 TaxID=3373255 RepID=UPI0037495A44